MQNLNIDNLTLSSLDAVSAVICFVLVWYMAKPYRYTGGRQYIGLPLAFSFLDASFFMGLARLLESASIVDVMRWIQLFTQSYAYAFLAVTYFFSKTGKNSTRIWLKIAFVGILSVAVVSYIFIFVAPIYDLPNFNSVDDYMRIFNIVCLTYIVIYVLRGYVHKPTANTIWIPFGFLMLDFSQYSFLIWSLDASFIAFLGAHFLRLVGLLIILIVAYQIFFTSSDAYPRKGIE
jgi:hypothetical protein